MTHWRPYTGRQTGYWCYCGLPLLAPSPCGEMALELSLKGFLVNFGNETLLRIHLFEAPILALKLFQAFHHGGIHTDEFCLSLLELGRAHHMLPAQIGHRYAIFIVLQNREYLAFAITWLFHRRLLSINLMEFYTFNLCGFSSGIRVAFLLMLVNAFQSDSWWV